MKNRFIDNAYLKAYNLFLDYGGLAVSAIGGAALGDPNHAVFNEASRGPLAGTGFIGAFAIPGLDSLTASGTLLYSEFDGDNTLYNEYIGSQTWRNMFTYFGAWQLMEGCKMNSPLNIATGVTFSGLALAGHIIGRRSKKELKARIHQRNDALIPNVI